MNGKILIVDDSNTDLLIINDILSEYDTLMAKNGKEALQKLEKHPDIDLIILDLNMPIIDGFKLLEIVKSSERLKHIRTIILTNYDETDKEIKGLKLGAIDYIRKPIHLEALRSRINIHIQLIRAEKILSQKLNEKNITLDTLLDQAPIGIAIFSGDRFNPDRSSNILMINSKFEQIIGRKKEEIIKYGWETIIHPEDLREDIQKYNKLLQKQTNGYSMEERYIKPDGSIVWVDMTISPIKINQNKEFNYICIIQDITIKKEQEIKIKHLSEIDFLTNLYNRKYLENIIRKDLKTKGNKAIVLLNFKRINNINLTYGYNLCEEIIKELTIKLSSLVGENCKLYQISFERLAFYITKYDDKKQLVDLCEKIIQIISSNQILHTIGGGIGVIEIDKFNYDPESIIKNVSTTAERTDENKTFGYRFFDKELELEITREIEIKECLMNLLRPNSKDYLYLEYQPIINLKTNKIESLEALVRLNSHKLGLVSPGEFIPIAEETQLIIPIGKEIIYKTCLFLKKLEATGYNNISISANVSGLQLIRDEFMDEILDILDNTKVNPSNFGIEITESVFAGNYNLINEKLKKLKKLGIKIAIDDFGTGYSSFAYESELQVNCLKIDKYFVDKLLCIDNNKAVIGDIISMAHKLGHCVIAEGVEYENQKKYLMKYNCDMMQGYLFSKPLNEENIIKLLKQYKCS